MAAVHYRRPPVDMPPAPPPAANPVVQPGIVYPGPHFHAAPPAPRAVPPVDGRAVRYPADGEVHILKVDGNTIRFRVGAHVFNATMNNGSKKVSEMDPAEQQKLVALAASAAMLCEASHEPWNKVSVGSHGAKMYIGPTNKPEDATKKLPQDVQNVLTAISMQVGIMCGGNVQCDISALQARSSTEHFRDQHVGNYALQMFQNLSQNEFIDGNATTMLSWLIGSGLEQSFRSPANAGIPESYKATVDDFRSVGKPGNAFDMAACMAAAGGMCDLEQARDGIHVHGQPVRLGFNIPGTRQELASWHLLNDGTGVPAGTQLYPSDPIEGEAAAFLFLLPSKDPGGLAHYVTVLRGDNNRWVLHDPSETKARDISSQDVGAMWDLSKNYGGEVAVMYVRDAAIAAQVAGMKIPHLQQSTNGCAKGAALQIGYLFERVVRANQP